MSGPVLTSTRKLLPTFQTPHSRSSESKAEDVPKLSAISSKQDILDRDKETAKNILLAIRLQLAQRAE
jgi:hypothetical protein